MKKTFMASVLATTFICVNYPVFAQEAANKVSNVENSKIVLEKIRADKKYLVSRNITLTESESKAFWPVYESYQDELQKINIRTAELIKDYAKAYTAQTMTDDLAVRLTNASLSIEADELNLKKSHFSRFQRILPAIKAARYMQIENKIRARVKVELSEAIPLVESQP